MRRLVSFDDVEKHLKQGKALYFEVDDGKCIVFLGKNGEVILGMWDRDHNDDEEDVCKVDIEQLRKLQQEFDLVFYVFDEQ